MKKTYKITGVDCANCAAKMEAQIAKLNGVNSCSLSFVTQRLTIDAEPEAHDGKDQKIRGEASGAPGA